jgi:hypothetical protein
MTRVGFTRFRRVIVGLMAMSGGEVGMTGGGGGVLRLEIAFRFPVMVRGFLIMMRGIVMMARRRMLAGHVATSGQNTASSPWAM